MLEYHFLDTIPLWGIFVGTVMLILLAVEGGYQIGTARRRRPIHETEGPISPVVSTTLGLLAFVLAVTVGIAIARFDARRSVFFQEVGAISTAYLLVDLLPPRHRDPLKSDLREYVNVRLMPKNVHQIETAIRRSVELHRSMWARTLASAIDTPNPLIVTVIAQSLNQVFDLHTKRVAEALESRIPVVLWMVLYLIALLGGVELGYQTSIAGSPRTPSTVALAVSFAAILWLVADLDRPLEGKLRVSLRALRELQQEMPLDAQPETTPP